MRRFPLAILIGALGGLLVAFTVFWCDPSNQSDMKYSWQITVAPSSISADEREFARRVRTLVISSVLYEQGLDYALGGATIALLGLLWFDRFAHRSGRKFS